MDYDGKPLTSPFTPTVRLLGVPPTGPCPWWCLASTLGAKPTDAEEPNDVCAPIETQALIPVLFTLDSPVRLPTAERRTRHLQ